MFQGIHRRRRHAVIATAAALVLSLLGGCRTPLPPLGPYEYFGSTGRDDAWSQKIHGWQERERSGVSELQTHAGVPETGAGVEHPGLERSKVGDLRSKYDSFRADRRRSLARDVANWIQTEAREGGKGGHETRAGRQAAREGGDAERGRARNAAAGADEP